MEKSSEWFENELSIDDIENSFLASLKPFRSGKFYLLRCNLSPVSELSGSGVKIYDEDGKDMQVEDVKENKKMICIININEIRFSSKNFQIDYYVKQIMVLNDVNINNEKLLLMDTNDEVNNVVSKKINDNEKEKLQDSNLLGEIKKETINELNNESYEKPKQETKDELNNKPSEEAMIMKK